MARRKHSKIDALPPDIKSTVEEMILANFKYADIADYIQLQTEEPISLMSISRYATNLNASDRKSVV